MKMLTEPWELAPSGPMLLTDALERFIKEDCEGRILEREVKRYREIQYSWKVDMPPMPPNDVCPKHLKAWRSMLITGKYHTQSKRSYSHTPRVRPQVERYVRCFVNAMRWFAEEQLCSMETYERLRCVRGLRKGEQGVKEPEPQVAVERDIVLQTVAVLKNESARDMILLMLHVGMRPSEVVILWDKDIDKSRDVWVWRLDDHKTDNVIGSLEYRFGPRSREIITRQASKKRLEKGPLFRNDRGEPWNVDSFSKMVRRQCRRHNIPLWCPKQIRKRFSTDVAADYGLDGEAAIVGHSAKIAAKSYAARNAALADEIARKLG